MSVVCLLYLFSACSALIYHAKMFIQHCCFMSHVSAAYVYGFIFYNLVKGLRVAYYCIKCDLDVDNV